MKLTSSIFSILGATMLLSQTASVFACEERSEESGCFESCELETAINAIKEDILSLRQHILSASSEEELQENVSSTLNALAEEVSNLQGIDDEQEIFDQLNAFTSETFDNLPLHEDDTETTDLDVDSIRDSLSDLFTPQQSCFVSEENPIERSDASFIVDDESSAE